MSAALPPTHAIPLAQAAELYMASAYAGPVALSDVMERAAILALEMYYARLPPQVVSVLRARPGVRCDSYGCRLPLVMALAAPCGFRLCPGHGAPEAPEACARWVKALWVDKHPLPQPGTDGLNRWRDYVL